jgi:tetratricopeptide (TPR) repeat protein
VSWFGGATIYDRGRTLEAAARARRRGRRRKAVDLYRRVLALEPNNMDIERRVAPLLAETKRPDEAWKAYRRAADALARKGFVEQAIGIYREAAGYLPGKVELWHALSDLEIERGRKRDAVTTLLEGRRHLRGRKRRREAIALLERGRRIDARHFETGFELAGLLRRDGMRYRARRVLSELADWTSGAELRRVRLRQLRMEPTPAAAWRWLRSVCGRR